MKKKKKISEQQAKYNRGQIFVKIVAAILSILMITAVSMTFINAIIG